MKRVVLILCCTVLTGCAVQPNSGSVYSSHQAGREQTVRTGVVESVREVTIDKGQSGVGTLAGGALGGIAAGSNIGRGNGAIAAGILGAVAGGVAGKHVESNLTQRRGLEITVRLDNGGGLRAVTQDADELFRPGERVRLLSSGGSTRVTH